MLRVAAHIYSSLLVTLLKINIISINPMSRDGFGPSFSYM